MNNAAARVLETELTEANVSREIGRFLNGETNGELLLDALYGAVGEEPVPEHLLQIVRALR